MEHGTVGEGRRGKEKERLERKGGRVTHVLSVDSSVTYTVFKCIRMIQV